MRDVSRILTDAELLKLRELLKQAPTQPIEANAFQEYPRALYHPDYLTCYRLIKDHPDPLVKKDANDKLRNVVILVHDFETEEEYLADGWVSDPNVLVIAQNIADGMSPDRADPRVPVGREGRRASKQVAQDRESELRSLKRRYAELTGTRMGDDLEADPLPVPASLVGAGSTTAAPKRPELTRPRVPTAATKRERVAQAAKRSAGTTASV